MRCSSTKWTRLRPTSKPIRARFGRDLGEIRARSGRDQAHCKADQGELARLNAVVDKVKDVVDDMTDANGDRDDNVRRIEKVTGVIPGVFTQVWNYGRNSRRVHSGLELRA